MIGFFWCPNCNAMLLAARCLDCDRACDPVQMETDEEETP